jgi:hypothetical protein
VEEVGQAMMTSMKVDKNGAVFSIMPDSPLIEFPNYRTTYGYLVSFGLGFGQILSRIHGTYSLRSKSCWNFCFYKPVKINASYNSFSVALKFIFSMSNVTDIDNL